MPAIRRLLNHVTVETAKKRRRCGRSDEHAIAGGDACLVVREPSYQGSKNYCCPCARDILAKAKEDLKNLELSLVGATTASAKGKSDG